MTTNPANDWQPTAPLRALKLRAGLYALIRRFFAERGVLEVETPILSEAGNTDPNIQSLSLEFEGPAAAGQRRRWLRTSPEHALKRLLAAGVGDCYELGRVFRNGEAGKCHNPEFTMLEWYREGWDHHRLMEECADLVQAAMALVGKRTTVRRMSFGELYRDRFGLDPHTASEAELYAPLAMFGIDPQGLTRDDLLDLLMTHLVQPVLPDNRILLLYDYPASQCALARIRPGEPPVAERFELYLGPLELANGYHELCDAGEQRERFGRDLVVRHRRGQVRPPVDERLLAALDAGLPSCAGVALGVDRLLMAMLGCERIADVLAFPFERA
ncbi:EF-P lysine aminoacylase EpmA [Rehaibacterium terrae]|jgi:lysyl-tRNA synthetase class 2|uniref:Lysyl-tRNA synthetase class 2 n=1 Tax=Rehaibacterium terrae TaxID=1341696 RepID=A0A7W7XXZ9_9GAMM|nr:EF-P lysine aminoacylase EpmA [Rehaibacterium terrae]MBB5014349.1 lysyl-tRNA synthetase class 2 [Rehaibacterium terrae]